MYEESIVLVVGCNSTWQMLQQSAKETRIVRWWTPVFSRSCDHKLSFSLSS